MTEAAPTETRNQVIFYLAFPASSQRAGYFTRFDADDHEEAMEIANDLYGVGNWAAVTHQAERVEGLREIALGV